MRSRFLLLAAILLLPQLARSQFERRLIVDETWSAPVGANDLLTVHEALVAGQDLFLPHRFTDESAIPSKLAGVLYRVARTVLLENVIDHLIFLTQHEVFGHGGRHREFLNEDVSYSLHVIPPYGDGAGTTSGSGYYVGPEFSDLLVRLGGSQAGATLASEQRYRLLSAGVMDHRQSNLYLAGMLDLTHYVLRTHQVAFTSNDVANSLYQIYGDRANARLNELHKEVLLNFIDPMQWYAAYNLIVNNFWFGSASMAIPMIDLGGVGYLPDLRLGLTPYGTEYFLENYARLDSTVFGLIIAMDEDADFSRVSLNARYLPITSWLTLDAQLQLWDQPRFRGANEKLTGVLLSVTPSIKIWSEENRTTSIVAQLGFKSKGFIEGEMFDFGPILRAGLSFR